MKLSQRLETVASFVPQGSSIADIGTDHGYIPIYLVEQGTAEHAIAMDVRSGPLERAKSHIREAGLEDKIKVRLSDGLLKLCPGEADCVVIAGMGGELMIHILEAGRHMWDTVRYWVLSPHSDCDKVRHYLEEQSFFIDRETMMKEDGKYYSILGITRDGKRQMEYGSETYYRYGKHLIEEKNGVLLEYLQKERVKLEGILSGLRKQDSETAERRMSELIKELSWNKEAQDEMQ